MWIVFAYLIASGGGVDSHKLEFHYKKDCEAFRAEVVAPWATTSCMKKNG